VEITHNRKKNFFVKNKKINLSKKTIRWIVNAIQNINFTEMEEDIHGRMFETFLDVTVRGKELGQFFTPRDIVNLMVKLATINVGKGNIDTVLDACFGSDGF